MTYALRDHERQLIAAALKLANCREQNAKKAVQKFAPLLSPAANLEHGATFDANVCIGHRRNLREWFTRIVGSVSERRAVAREVNASVEGLVTLSLRLREKKGGYRIESEIGLDYFAGALAMATALILDDRFGLASRLKQCGNPKCGKFNLDLKPHGRPRTHCNAACKKAADATTSAERSRRHREKKAKRQKR